jgi:Na+-transporting methylmalonyl-CoA/oxaloacetate decarboxylase gamma subunit
MMETAGYMWTIAFIGISTVFLSLIALVAMVSIFKLIFVRSAPRQAPKAEAPVQAAPAAARGIDPAVVAVIIAAIATASGVPASSLRIASIERSGFNTPVWGYADRVTLGSSFGRA